MAEQFTRNEQVVSSILTISSRKTRCLTECRRRVFFCSKFDAGVGRTAPFVHILFLVFKADLCYPEHADYGKGEKVVRSDEFIDLYKQLEDALEEKFSGMKRRYSSVVFEYINHYESAPVRESLNLCREIRNLMTHSANLGGVPIVEPSEPVVEALRAALEYVQRPPLALEYATTGQRIVCAGLSDRVLKLMAMMDKNGFSHIPILDKKRFIGVFSVSTIFSCLLLDPELRLTQETTIRELGQMLPVDRHIENYAFVDRRTPLLETRRMFEKIRGRNKRLSVIFITETGSREEPLLGMLTPYDVMQDD